ncbi:MAG TPA: hydantoinase B/oxoprolinase family protein [Solirubrobacteraceae bacterium]
MPEAVHGEEALLVEIHRKALENVTKEMGITLVRTSGSGAVYDGKDFCTCLLDETPEHLAFSGYVTFHIGSSLVGAQAIVAELPDDLRPGDGYILSDPRSAGAMHQADVGVMMPTFAGEELLGWTFANMHVVDVGGVGISGKAPGARDVYQEGIRFPPIRVIRDGRLDPSWERFIAANVRSSERVVNDIRSLLAANIAGERKLAAIVQRHGIERHRALCARSKDLTERLFRQRIGSMRDGVYEVEDWAEFDGHNGPDRLLDLGGRMVVAGEQLRFEFSGAPQIDGFVNCSAGAIYGQCMSAVMVMLCYGDLPINAGLWRALSIELGPQGTVVNSTDPAPCSNGHSEVGMRVCKMTKALLSQAMALSEDPVIRSRVAGQSQDGTASVALFGTNQHGGSSVVFYVDMGVGIGGGAQSVGDGQDSYGATAQMGCGLPDVESHEADDPVLWLWRELVPNSGGPGLTRGGQGISQGFTIYGTDRLGGPGFNACAEVPPRGFGGGSLAAAGRHYVLRASNVHELLAAGIHPLRSRIAGRQETPAAKVGHLILEPGDVQIWQGGGGGGLGDPLLRPPELVLRDVHDGYISAEHALAAYGVAVADGQLDLEATLRSRRALRTARLGEAGSTTQQATEDAVAAPHDPGIAIVPAGHEVFYADAVDTGDAAWACGACGAPLASADGSWIGGATVQSRTPLAAHLAALDMYVRPRTAPPALELVTRCCARCAAALTEDIVPSGGEPRPPLPTPIAAHEVSA